MTRSLLGQLPLPGVPGVPGVTTLARGAGLAIIVATIAISDHPPGLTGRGLAVTITLALSCVAWFGWMLAGNRARLATPALTAMALAGGVLTAVSADSGAAAIGSVAAMSASANLSTDVSVGIMAEAVASFLISGLVVRLPVAALLGLTACFIGFWTVGLTRRAYIMRAEQAERLLAESRRATAAETEAAAMAERTRIARDIHDVLAHSLAAVSVNLEAASGLLSSDSPDVARALECVNRASALTRDGLADAKRAVHALREAAPPLAERLAALVSGFESAGDAAASFTVDGTPRPVPAEAGLAVYRTAQEALTNARKHSPGQYVAVSLSFPPSSVSLDVVNGLTAADAGALALSGGGYGLAGLRERAAQAGGTLDAGPADGQWRVSLKIPV